MISNTVLSKEYGLNVPYLSATTGVGRIDRFIGELVSSNCCIFEGDFSTINTMVSLVAVNVAKRFGKKIVFLDGDNSIDVYKIASLSRMNQVDANLVLSSLLVSRAFTAYQFDSLIYSINTFCNDFHPALLIVNGLTNVLFDKDIQKDEGEYMIENWIYEITMQTRKHNTISIITMKANTMCFFQYSMSYVDKIVQFERKKKSVKIMLPNQRRAMTYMSAPAYQHVIDDFVEVGHGANTAHI
jgi:hypothetical protein